MVLSFVPVRNKVVIEPSFLISGPVFFDKHGSKGLLRLLVLAAGGWKKLNVAPER
jgi:hypothetical protein